MKNPIHKSTRPVSKGLGLSAILLAASSFTFSAQAGLIAYEGFNYAAPTADISTLTGTGTGFTGNWSSGANPAFAVSSGSLSYGGTAALASSGNQVGLSNGGNFFYSGTTRSLASAITSGDAWVSWLYNASNTNGNNAYSNLSLTSGGTGLTFIGDPGSESNDQRLELSVGATRVFGSNLVDSQTYFFTLHITGINTGANTAFDLFVNDNLTTPTLSITGQTFAGFDGVELQTGNNIGGNTAAFDEIRIGTTVGDVTTVPEPSTWLYFSVAGVLGVVIRHRRLRVRSA